TATTPPGLEDTDVPVANAPLAGGGFESVRMNPNFTSAMTLTVTSSHMVTGGDNMVWGYGVTSTVANPGAANTSLTCTNCHNPHGRAGTGDTPTYRLLKGGSANNTPLFSNGTISPTATFDVPDEAPYARWYFIDEWRDANYFGYHTYDAYQNGQWVNINAALSGWCAQCHTRYMASYSPTATLPSSTDSGDAVFKYRHVTNRSDDLTCTGCHSGANWNPPVPGCVSCHVAHGTGTSMSQYSGSVPWPGGTTGPSGNARSSLLRLDNRGVCRQCHNPT
ncbi:MAG: hypothetical protein M1358_22570, partial [Chloroflexi bacterium]|nr:hypothetical protein [Chloroflexota bacterium]